MDGFVVGLLLGGVAMAALVASGSRRARPSKLVLDGTNGRPAIEVEDATEARAAWRAALSRAARPRLRPASPTPLVVSVDVDATEVGR